MSYQTVYCVETFRRQGRGLERAGIKNYALKSQALEWARIIRAKVVGLMVYSVEIDTVSAIVGKIEVLTRRGSVPPLRY